MATPLKLQQKEQRQVALSYLAGVPLSYIQQQWGISAALIKQNIVVKRSHSWEDPLIEFYRKTESYNRARNAIHLYLAFQGQAEGLLGVELVDITDLRKDRPVYEALESMIFTPKAEQVIKETHLERILAVGKKEESAIEKLSKMLQEEKETYPNALEFIAPIVYQHLREAYVQPKKVNFQVLYEKVTAEIFGMLNLGLEMVQNPQMIAYAQGLKEERTRRLHDGIQKVITSLTPQEQKVLRVRFGIETERETLEQLGQEFELTRERIRQIEAKALEKLRGLKQIPRQI